MAENYSDKTKEQLKNEWNHIEKLIEVYQKRFSEFENKEDENKAIADSEDAASELLHNFNPLFQKYIILIKSNDINFNDKETRAFISSFMTNKNIIKTLKSHKIKSVHKDLIYNQFNFVREIYGVLDAEEIRQDLQLLLLKLAKRYKCVGKSFCRYIAYCYKYEVSRFIKNFIKNPLNISYKKIEYEDKNLNTHEEDIQEKFLEDLYEDSSGIPNFEWIQGISCSELFQDLRPLDRKILVKYYLEYWNDRQIANQFGMHILTINARRRKSIFILAQKCNINLENLKRNRRSGKKAILPSNKNN